MRHQITETCYFAVIFMSLAGVLSGCKPQTAPEVAKIDQSGQVNPWTNLEWNNDPKNFQFVVVTDRTGGMRPGIFEQGVEKVNLLQPEFVLSVGDLIDGYTEDVNEIKRQWDEFDEFVTRLNMPFFYVVGNHDITNKVMEDIWKERLGATYYHFVYQDVLFLCLNSEEGLDAHRSSFFSEEQRAYVRQALADNPDVRWTLVFLHKPVWLAEESPDKRIKQQVEKSGWSEIEAMLQDRKHTVYAGHIHRYTHRKRENNNYITLATTGGGSRLGGPIFGQFDHVLWVTMTDEGPIMANLMLEGIWDEDFSREDIENYLTMELKRKSVMVEAALDDKQPLTNESFDLRLFNAHEVPMEVSINLNNSEHISFTPDKIVKTVPPNSVEKTSIQIKVLASAVASAGATDNEEEPGWKKLWDELEDLPVYWEIAYDFEKYGKISVKGSAEIY